MESAIESFIRYLAVERGLSDNYQLSTQRSLSDFASWCAEKTRGPRSASGPEWPTARGQHEKTAWRAVTLPMISEYLAEKKKARLSAASIKLIVVALKIFFRFLAGKGEIKRDPTEPLSLPRIERYLPETLNEIQVEQLLNGIDTKVALGLRDRAMIELLYASCSGGTQSVRGAGLLFVHRAAETDKAPERERDFFVRTRNQINDRANLADREGKSAPRGLGKKYLSAFAPAQLRDAPAEQRRGPAHHSRDARPRRYFDDAGLYARRSAAFESGASTISSPGVIETEVDR